MLPSIKSIFHLLETCPTQESCIEFLEGILWKDGVVSPFDVNSTVYRCKNGKYKCRNSNKYFTVLTGTMFEGTKLPLRLWFMAIWHITTASTGVTSVFIAKHFGITQKTAWHLMHRIRAAFKVENNHVLEGTVETDETFYGGKNKNRHKKNKFDYSKGNTEKIPVLGMIQRGGNIVCRVIPDRSKESMQSVVVKHLKNGSRLITDEHTSYKGLEQIYDHDMINHSAYEYVSLEDLSLHNNNIESAWRSFKRMASGTYSHVSKKHLQSYTDEFVYRYNMRKHPESDKFLWLIANCNIKTTWKELKSREFEIIEPIKIYKPITNKGGRKQHPPYPWNLN